jgi:hypothetical protein
MSVLLHTSSRVTLSAGWPTKAAISGSPASKNPPRIPAARFPKVTAGARRSVMSGPQAIKAVAAPQSRRFIFTRSILFGFSPEAGTMWAVRRILNGRNQRSSPHLCPRRVAQVTTFLAASKCRQARPRREGKARKSSPPRNGGPAFAPRAAQGSSRSATARNTDGENSIPRWPRFGT